MLPLRIETLLPFLARGEVRLLHVGTLLLLSRRWWRLCLGTFLLVIVGDTVKGRVAGKGRADSCSDAGSHDQAHESARVKPRLS